MVFVPDLLVLNRSFNLGSKAQTAQVHFGYNFVPEMNISQGVDHPANKY